MIKHSKESMLFMMEKKNQLFHIAMTHVRCKLKISKISTSSACYMSMMYPYGNSLVAHDSARCYHSQSSVEKHE